MSDAPSCPISFGTAVPGSPLFHKGDPYAKVQRLKDQINSIPRAHDLPSVINALNIINNIVTQITRGDPAINNVGDQGGGGVILKGDDFNPHYQQADWILEGRSYERQKLVNPDNNDQYIEIRTLKTVTFINPNGANLTYYGQTK